MVIIEKVEVRLIADAGGFFNSLVLYTDTAEAVDFYHALGFTKTEPYQKVTKVSHYLKIKPINL
ncbi:hypothetical protein [Alkalihalobacterium chitinilyticum]|uniref:GNAT family N-acetyltransferase n=1 Tax=Alkalihalobacterium chitinilyticum TaxID=2980103 RepID=A0ABT5VEI2_9BACI|nr:hypothetical protein [Alkalihalobacterium chitinilyticum]MDE5413551.1 hypothetical protein [Alkalihalobacterium chitinilyticum]